MALARLLRLTASADFAGVSADFAADCPVDRSSGAEKVELSIFMMTLAKLYVLDGITAAQGKTLA